MKGRIIEVISYSGYKGEERPAAFVWGGRRVEVAEVVRSWVEEDMPSRERLRCFRVKDSDGSIRVLCFSQKSMEWYLTER